MILTISNIVETRTLFDVPEVGIEGESGQPRTVSFEFEGISYSIANVQYINAFDIPGFPPVRHFIIVTAAGGPMVAVGEDGFAKVEMVGPGRYALHIKDVIAKRPA